jgi:hypothetical protein
MAIEIALKQLSDSTGGKLKEEGANANSAANLNL